MSKAIKFVKELLDQIEYMNIHELQMDAHYNGYDNEDIILALEKLENKGYLHCEGEYIIKTEGIEE